MARILSFETSTVVCSVAIHENGVATAVSEIAERNAHSARLTVLTQELLEAYKLTINDFDAIAVSMGPGSYTGLRIGASVAKGLCYAANKPLIAVDTLKALALQGKKTIEKIGKELSENSLLYPMIDARRMEVFTAEFNSNLESNKKTFALIVDDETIKDFAKDTTYYLFGDGSEKLKETLKAPNIKYIRDVNASAYSIGILAEELFNKKEFVDLAYFEPFYLKEFKATTPKKNVLG